VLAGCSFAFGGFVAGVGWPQHAMSAILLPVVFLYLLRVARGASVLGNASMAGAVLGTSFLMGHHNVPIFCTLSVVGVWLYFLTVVRRPSTWKDWAPCAVFFLCFGLIAAAQLLPALEFGHESVRWVGSKDDPLGWQQKVPYGVYGAFSINATSFLGFIIAGLEAAVPAFIGIVTVALAILGAFIRWQERPVRILSAVAAGAFLYALGPASLLHGILYAIVPGLDKARSASDAMAVGQFACAVLAAFALDAYRKRLVLSAHHRWITRLLIGTGLLTFGAAAVVIGVHPESQTRFIPFSMFALVCLLLAGILHAWYTDRLRNRSAATLIILLMLFELNYVTNASYRPYTDDAFLKQLGRHRDIAEFLKRQPQPLRVEVDGQAIFYNFGDWYGIDQLGGVGSAMLNGVAALQGENRVRMMLGTGYYVGPKPIRADQVELAGSESGQKIYSNPEAFPRARLVYDSITAPGETQVIAKVTDPSVDLKRTAIIEKEYLSLGGCSGGSVQITKYNPTVAVLRVQAACRGMVILADSWFPGWMARVDGKPARLYKVYDLVRGVVVEAGQHEVEFVYWPWSVYFGAALALLGIGCCIILRRISVSHPST
jgi:hypothetical protein